MPFWRPEKLRQEELLDTDDGTEFEIRESLHDLRRINRYLGGYRASLAALHHLIRAHGLPRFSLLDLATGNADFPLVAANWAASHRLPCEIVGMDLSRRHLNYANARIGSSPIRLVQGNVHQLPFSRRSFDFVNTTLFLHHLNDAEIVEFLQAAFSVARVGVIVNDLNRHWVPYFFLKLTQPIFARSRITRWDGFASLRQAFTAAELRDYARRCGVSRFTVRHRFPYRLVLLLEKE